ncbi:cysteine hydrolase family protein [Paenibacillus turpanensis]|uniref:cysteine hydrolase family protein n=1 Tax=Paenibacillus turpanensis TaxID=2689078 RepID=UPI00140BD444|nr:isochorismatase family protein [Paenibacillus turpanensis]
MRIAMLVIDMQSIYLQEEPIEKKVIDKACMYINHVSNVLRSNDHIVIHIQDVDGLQESNKEMYEVIPEIQINAKDLRLTKENSNAFWKTELEQILLEHNVGLVIVSGFAAEHCVLFTYNGAIERGFKSVILQNGIISTKNDAISSTYRDRNLISYPVVEYLINQ